MPNISAAKNIQSISRAIAILRCFNDFEELGLTEISKMVGLHKSTTAGIVQTLKNEGMLEQNEETSKFRLGIELYGLSLNIKMDLRDLCLPYLDKLLEETGETVNLVLLDNNMIVYVEKKESSHSMRICTKIGHKMPLYCTGVGKAILAFLPEDRANKIIEETHFEQFTENTVTNAEKLKEMLGDIRKQGYGFDMEELEYGLVCVGVPLLDSKGIPVAGMSISGPSTRMTDEKMEIIIEKIFDAVTSISAQSHGKYTIPYVLHNKL